MSTWLTLLLELWGGGSFFTQSQRKLSLGSLADSILDITSPDILIFTKYTLNLKDELATLQEHTVREVTLHLINLLLQDKGGGK